MKYTNIKKLLIKFMGGGLINFPTRFLRWIKIDGDAEGDDGGGGEEGNLSKTANVINKLFTPTAPQPIGVYRISGQNCVIYDYEDYMMYRNGTDTKIIDSWTETEQSNVLPNTTLLYPSGTTLQKGMPLNIAFIDVEYPILLTNGADGGLLVYNPLPDSESDEIVQNNFYMEEVTLNNKIYAAVRDNNK